MLVFCPTCHNSLVIKEDIQSTRFVCQTCPYKHDVTTEVKSRQYPTKLKEVDDVLGGEDSWKHVDKTQAECVKCKNPDAYFIQIQIRSADEPMTVFYRCTNADCNHQWRGE